MRNKRALLCAALIAAGLAVGCGKKKTGALSPELELQPTASADALNQPVAVQEAPYQTRDLQLSVDAYQKIYHRQPASLEQMVQEGFLASLPPAPPGKRFVLDSATGRVRLEP